MDITTPFRRRSFRGAAPSLLRTARILFTAAFPSLTLRTAALLALTLLIAAPAALLLGPPAALAGTASTSTTTTLFDGTTTTTMFVPTDVTGGGRFEGAFPKGSFDSYSFELTEPRVLVAETSNGFGGCPGDTIVELRQLGTVGSCNGMYGDELPCIAFDDDNGISLCSRLVKHIVPPGSYEIRVRTVTGSQLLRYFLEVDFIEIECGNGELEITEGCDDGNLESGDCCSSACQLDAAGTACDDGSSCNGSDNCDAAGICSVHAGGVCTGADGDGDCSESCSDVAAGCTHPDNDGVPCDDGSYCNGPDFCEAGACSVHLGDPCPGPDNDFDCSEVCDEESDTCSGLDPDGADCDDGLFCNSDDTCEDGSCSVHAGDPCTGADGDGNCAESCSEPLNACVGADPNGSACNDGLFCNGTDKCAMGSCSNHQNAPCAGPDGDANCQESCDEAADICTVADPDASPCDDGIFCNGADTCLAGACSQHAGNPCAGPDGDDNCAETCNEAADTCTGADANGSPCNDGIFCNGADTCLAGACSQHAGDPCPGVDGDIQCSESCDEAADDCAAPDPEGSPCEDGLDCTGADTCVEGTCSGHTLDPCPGPDGDADCSESCNDDTGGCGQPDPNGSPCDDGVFCNGADTCSAGSCSVHTGDPCPGGDGDGDCTESCNEAGDSCTAADPAASPCDDANSCTEGSTCNGSGACTGGMPVECEVQCADQNGDGQVKASDALAILKTAVGGDQCDAEPCACDTNSSGSVTAADALVALKLAVGAPVVANCPC